MKGFTKDGKFRPTGRTKSALSKEKIRYKTNNPVKEMKIAYKKHLDEKKKKSKKPLHEIIDDEVEKRVEDLHDDTKAYDDYLDEVGDLNQLVSDYTYSRLLKDSDPIAYRVGHSEHDELSDDEYDDYLDSVGEDADANDLSLGAYSNILKDIDDVAYRTGRNDWSDGERDRLRDEVNSEIDDEASLESGEFEEK